MLSPAQIVLLVLGILSALCWFFLFVGCVGGGMIYIFGCDIGQKKKPEKQYTKIKQQRVFV